MGTGHVAINGIIYTVLDDANTILSVDPDTGALQASAALPNAMVSGAGNYSYGGKSYIDLSADDGRLYAIYTTVAAGGNLVVSELDLTTLAVLNTWTASSAPWRAGYGRQPWPTRTATGRTTRATTR